MSLSKTHQSLLSTGSTKDDTSGHNWKNVLLDIKNQINQKGTCSIFIAYGQIDVIYTSAQNHCSRNNAQL